MDSSTFAAVKEIDEVTTTDEKPRKRDARERNAPMGMSGAELCRLGLERIKVTKAPVVLPKPKGAAPPQGKTRSQKRRLDLLLLELRKARELAAEALDALKDEYDRHRARCPTDTSYLWWLRDDCGAGSVECSCPEFDAVRAAIEAKA